MVFGSLQLPRAMRNVHNHQRNQFGCVGLETNVGDEYLRCFAYFQ